MAAGQVPYIEACRQFQLSAVESHVLAVVCSAALRPEVVRLFRAITDAPSRPTVDAELILDLLDYGGRWRTLARRALRADGRLRRQGLIRARDDAPFAPIEVDPVLLARLHGDPAPGLRPGVTVRDESVALDRLHLHPETRAQVDALVTRLAAPVAHPPIVLRGGRGSGRPTLATTLAARHQHTLTEIDVTKLEGGCTVEALREEVRRAALRGSWPCIVGLEQATRGLSESMRRALCAVVQEASGRIVVLASPRDLFGFDPLWPVIEFLPLSPHAVTQVWLEVLEYPQTPIGPLPNIAPGHLRAAATATIAQEPTVSVITAAATRHALAALPPGLEQRPAVPWTEVAGAAARAPLLRRPHRHVLLLGAPGSGREHVARAIVGAASAIRVDVPDLVAGDPLHAHARVDQLLDALEMGLFGAIFLAVDDAVRTRPPAVVSHLARGLARLPGPLAATSSGGPLGPFETLFDLRCLLEQSPADRNDVWRHHLGDHAADVTAQLAVMSVRPTALSTIATAARLFRLGHADTLAEAHALATAGLY